MNNLSSMFDGKIMGTRPRPGPDPEVEYQEKVLKEQQKMAMLFGKQKLPALGGGLKMNEETSGAGAWSMLQMDGAGGVSMFEKGMMLGHSGMAGMDMSQKGDMLGLGGGRKDMSDMLGSGGKKKKGNGNILDMGLGLSSGKKKLDMNMLGLSSGKKKLDMNMLGLQKGNKKTNLGLPSMGGGATKNPANLFGLGQGNKNNAQLNMMLGPKQKYEAGKRPPRNQEKKAWARMQTQMGLSMFGDYDKDKVPNMLDCWPRDPKRQDVLSTFKSFLPSQRFGGRELDLPPLPPPGMTEQPIILEPGKEPLGLKQVGFRTALRGTGGQLPIQDKINDPDEAADRDSKLGAAIISGSQKIAALVGGTVGALGRGVTEGFYGDLDDRDEKPKRRETPQREFSRLPGQTVRAVRGGLSRGAMAFGRSDVPGRTQQLLMGGPGPTGLGVFEALQTGPSPTFSQKVASIVGAPAVSVPYAVKVDDLIGGGTLRKELGLDDPEKQAEALRLQQEQQEQLERQQMQAQAQVQVQQVRQPLQVAPGFPGVPQQQFLPSQAAQADPRVGVYSPFSKRRVSYTRGPYPRAQARRQQFQPQQTF